MNVALVASSYLPPWGALERHVAELAGGLARRGVQVEVLTQGHARGLPSVSESGGVVVRRFPASIAIGNAHVAVAPGLWEHLRRAAASFDLVHAHTAHVMPGLAVARAGARRWLFTPHAPIERLLRWPYARVTRAIVEHAAHTVCTSRAQADLLCRAFPSEAGRVSVIPSGVDVAGIQASASFPRLDGVVLTVGRLERYRRVDRAIAVLPSLDYRFRLVVLGDGPAERRLEAYAADLDVSPRVEFIRSVPDADVYRWLRTARVHVALADRHAGGLQLLDAVTSGASVVASDIPTHREAASYVDGAGVFFVSPEGSPLEVADAILEADETRVPWMRRLHMPTWDVVVDDTLALYEELVLRGPRTARAPRDRTAKPRSRVVPAGPP
jgi:glycosyltransferase involved in cell wall biosynthesis